KRFSLPCERVPDLAEFAFDRRSHKVLELLEPVARRVVEVLLTKNALRPVPDNRERLVRICLLLRETPRRLPERRPHIAPRSLQESMRESALAQSLGFLAFAPSRRPRTEHPFHRLIGQRRFDLLGMTDQHLCPSGANGELPDQ